MAFAFFHRPARAGQSVRSKWIRGALVMSLAFTLSACAYDSPSYRSYGGYGAYQYGHYDRSHARLGHYRYSKHPDWRAQAGHRQAQRRHRGEAQRPRPHSRESRAQRQRSFEARKYPGVEYGKRRGFEQRNPVLGSGTAPRRHQ